MDYPRPADRQFDALATPLRISEKQAVNLAYQIAGESGTVKRNGRSTSFEIERHTTRVLMTVTPNSFRVAGNIQPGLKDLFSDHWDTVKAYTPTSPDDMEFFSVGLENSVTVNYGGGYKPNFVYTAYTLPDLVSIMRRIFGGI